MRELNAKLAVLEEDAGRRQQGNNSLPSLFEECRADLQTTGDPVCDDEQLSPLAPSFNSEYNASSLISPPNQASRETKKRALELIDEINNQIRLLTNELFGDSNSVRKKVREKRGNLESLIDQLYPIVRKM